MWCAVHFQGPFHCEGYNRAKTGVGTLRCRLLEQNRKLCYVVS